MGNYRIENFVINKNLYQCDTCDIRIVGSPNIYSEDMFRVKDYIEHSDLKIPINIPANTHETTLMVARGNGKTQFALALARAYGYQFQFKKIIFNGPATIVLWDDGSKTVVKCQDGDTFDKEKGIALCFMKKALGNKSNFNNVIKKWIPEE